MDIVVGRKISQTDRGKSVNLWHIGKPQENPKNKHQLQE